MSIDTTHIIKRDDVASSRVVQPDPSLLQGSLKIPVERVEMATEEEGSQPAARRRRVPSEHAVFAQESFEVNTRELEKTSRTATRRQEDEDEDLSIEGLQARWETRLTEEVANAHEEGVKAGKAALRAEMEQTIRQTKTTFAQNLDAIQQAWENHLKDSRVRLVQLAFRIADVVLDAPLPAEVRRISETAITDAIERMVDGIPVEIALHPVSYLRIQEAGLEEQLHSVHSKLRWRSDPTLKENEWIVQSDRSAMRRLEAELLDDLQRELSLRDLPSNDANADDATGARHEESDPDEPADL